MIIQMDHTQLSYSKGVQGGALAPPPWKIEIGVGRLASLAK